MSSSNNEIIYVYEGIHMDNIFVTRSSMPPYEDYIKAIKPLWDSHLLTNMGTYHKVLEEKLREYLRVPQLSLMVNGHTALEMAIQAFNFSEGSEVITTPFTFISTTHAIVRNRLVPVFCDVKLNDGTIDEAKIEELITEKTVAILPVHVYGNICNTDAIEEIAYRYNLKVIYDAAHAFGEIVQGKGVGSFGDASIFSFHATKVYNTIEGGAVTFKEHWLYEKLFNLKNFGIHGEELVTDIGANAKMNEFSAIMGLLNLEHIEEAIEDRRGGDRLYREGLGNVPGVRMLKQIDLEKNNYGYFPIVCEEEYRISRDQLYAELKSQGIYSRKYFYPLTSDQACFKNKYRTVPLVNARELSQKVLTLPLYEGLAEEDVQRIIEIIRKISGSLP